MKSISAKVKDVRQGNLTALKDRKVEVQMGDAVKAFKTGFSKVSSEVSKAQEILNYSYTSTRSRIYKQERANNLA